MHRRRDVLRFALAMGALGGSGVLQPVFAKGSAEIRRLHFYNLHTDESLDAVYWEKGAYVPQALSAIDKVLRDFRTGETHKIAPPLLDLLVTLNGTLGTRAPYQVISGYRSPMTNAKLAAHGGGVAQKSLHMQGMAIDVRIPGIALVDLNRAARRLQLGGVGYYAKSDFIHVDIGRVRYWG